MTKRAGGYTAAVITAGAALIAFAIGRWHSDDLMRFAAFLILFAVAVMFKFRVRGITGTYSLGFFFALLGSATLSYSEVALASAMAGIVQSAFKPERRPSRLQICFNAANLVISTSSGFVFMQGLIPGLNGQPLLTRLMLDAMAFYFVNTGLVSFVLTLIEHDSFWRIWRYWYLASLPYYLVGATVVAAVLMVEDPRTYVIVILVAPALMLATIYSRVWLQPR